MSLASIWNISRRDVEIPKSAPTELLLEKHKEFLLTCGRDKTSFEYIKSEYLRMSGIYWCLAALGVLGKKIIGIEVGKLNLVFIVIVSKTKLLRRRRSRRKGINCQIH